MIWPILTGWSLDVPDADDCRAVTPQWRCLADLVDGARQRGFTEARCKYLLSVIGVTWAKAYRAGQRMAESDDNVPPASKRTGARTP